MIFLRKSWVRPTGLSCLTSVRSITGTNLYGFDQAKTPCFGPGAVDEIIEAINPKVRQQPSLVHYDPYGGGWLFLVKPTNLQRNLDNLCFGEANAVWID
jgi:hypothetical protein